MIINKIMDTPSYKTNIVDCFGCFVALKEEGAPGFKPGTGRVDIGGVEEVVWDNVLGKVQLAVANRARRVGV